MHYLKNWQNRWGLPDQAIAELVGIMGIGEQAARMGGSGESESVVQQNLRFQMSQMGVRLWRNNVGVATDETGKFVRYGLANESKTMNTHLKSSDLIGITPMNINGSVYGIFTSYEVKKAGWRYTGAGREEAQRRWIELVISLGGIARFVS